MTRLPLPLLLYYGLFGLPLAMVALPIYVYLPQFYAERGGLSLALVGAVLLAARIGAAFIDPLLGWWIERGGGAFARCIAIALPLLLGGFLALFHPPPLGSSATMAWFLVSLLVLYVGFGLATIAHQSWGAALSHESAERSRVSGVREACALAGVVLAAGVAGVAGHDGLSLAFALALALAAAALLAWAPRPATASSASSASCAGRAGSGPHGPDGRPQPPWRAMATPFRQRRFRALFAVLIVNGVASAIPATLFLFFAADRLDLARYSNLLLVLYFGAAALSMPLWVVLAARLGEARAWTAGMLLSAAVFVWAFGLGAGAVLPFGAICILSGLALGADLALPPALLAGVIASAGHGGAREAAYFGAWNWGVQLTLALAAGIALPLLGLLGYVPGAQAGTAALAAAYALLPCAMKLAAAAMLWRAPLRDC